MVVAFAANKNWNKYLVISIYSLLTYTKDIKKIYIFTETTKIERIPYLKEVVEKYNNVEFVLINANPLIKKNIKSSSINKDSFFTDFALVKLMLVDVVLEDKVLYIDTDAIVKGDISNVWKYNISDFYIAGVRDFGFLERGDPELFDIAEKYINSGFVIFNLKKWREDNIKKKIFDVIDNTELIFPDQDAMNIVCNEKVFFLPSMYNFCDDVSLEVVNKKLAKVYHFAGIKDFWVANRLYAEEWYEVEENFYNEFGWEKYVP